MGEGGYGSGNGGRALLGCSCLLILLALLGLLIVFLLPLASGGAITEGEVFQPWTGYCFSCCCCIGSLVFPIGAWLTVTDQSGGPEKTGKWGR